MTPSVIFYLDDRKERKLIIVMDTFFIFDLFPSFLDAFIMGFMCNLLLSLMCELVLSRRLCM